MEAINKKPRATNFEIFQEVADENMRTFANRFKSESESYKYVNLEKINRLTEDEARQLALNFFIKELSKKVSEHQISYFDKKLNLKY